MCELYVDPDGCFAIESGARLVELWTVEAIRFERRERPNWQQRPGGAVARLHSGLRAMQPVAGDALTAAFDHPDAGERPDAENRLFTNVKEPAGSAVRGAPNPFAHLPRRIRFERRFERVEPPEPLRTLAIHYRYALEPVGSGWAAWCSEGDPLATWHEVPVSRISDGAGWPIWLGMRTPDADVRADYKGPPLAKDFAVELTLHACRAVQAVTVMEALVDGVVASFQREQHAARAERVAEALQRKPQLAMIPRTQLIDAQTAAPAILATSPWAVNPSGTWVQLSPADKWVVAGKLTVSPEPARSGHALSGQLFRVRPREQ